ncbi:MAG: hypothetical protein U0R24_13585 [Solirubrobacterales bacterium]
MSPDDRGFEDPFAEGDAARERTVHRALSGRQAQAPRQRRASLAERVSESWRP